jgi:hypothetical protein
MNLDWHGDEIVEELEGAVLRAMTDAAFDPYVLALRDQLSAPSPPASAPGTPPRHREDVQNPSGPSLIDSIMIWPDDDEFCVAVGSTAPYAIMLEQGTATMEPRPVWTDTLVLVMDQMGTRVEDKAADNVRAKRGPRVDSGDNANPLTTDVSQPGNIPVGEQRSIPSI